jgi:membrane-associated PAP2 superfamily phosphatase/nitrogen-specific signal transduction histidine kinase
MSKGRAEPLRWWVTRAVFPVVTLAAAAVALRRARVDAEALAPFTDATGSFPLRHDWFFENVLARGGLGFVTACTLVLALGLALRPRPQARACAYVVACVLVTIALAGLWRRLAEPLVPWDALAFGGARPWASADGFGAPSVHAASGFAWMALHFVGASLGTRQRWLWTAPGLLLGLLFTLGEHARGAQMPSDAPWAIALAWCVASALALLFRRIGWLDWREVEPKAPDAARAIDVAAPWLVGATVGFCGVGFFAVDMLTHQFEATHPGVHILYEYVELTSTALGFGVVAWLLTDRFLAMRAREARRAGEERERRFQELGRLTAAVAHEVRNPLQSLRLIVDEQRHDVAGLREHPLQPELEASIERIDRAVDLVYRLARPESGALECADLAQVAREAIVALGRLDRNRVRFAWEHDPPRAVVAASRPGLRIVLDNLLRNAAQATPANGTVRLELEPHSSGWQLRIKNPGSLSATAPAGGERGLGLGVPISRQLATNAGGSIDIEEQGGFVTCTLRWPREAGGAA